MRHCRRRRSSRRTAMASPGARELAYKLVRPSSVTANLVAPDGSTRPIFSGQAAPGACPFTWTDLTAEAAVEPGALALGRETRRMTVARHLLSSAHSPSTRPGLRRGGPAGSVRASAAGEGRRAVHARAGCDRHIAYRDAGGHRRPQGRPGGDVAGRHPPPCPGTAARTRARPFTRGRTSRTPTAKNSAGTVSLTSSSRCAGRVPVVKIGMDLALELVRGQVHPVPLPNMPIASITQSITDALTSFIGDHGVYAVFLLMFVDAVLPAASELVMLYAGALAAGAFVSQEDVDVFGREVPTGWKSFAVMVAAGTIGYTLGSLAGWAIGDYGGQPSSSDTANGSTCPRSALRVPSWFDRWEARRCSSAGSRRSCARSSPPGQRLPASSRPLHAADLHQLDHLVPRVRRHPAGRWARTGRASITPSGTSVRGGGLDRRRSRYLVLRWRSSRLNRRASVPLFKPAARVRTPFSLS